MISEHLESIGNYFWHEFTLRINDLICNEEVEDFNIGDYYYLIAIHNMGCPNLGQVANELHLTKPAISALVKRLQHCNLVEKIQSEEDRRVFYLKLTERGTKIVEGDSKIYSNLETMISDAITPSQVQALDCLLEVVSSVLKDA